MAILREENKRTKGSERFRFLRILCFLFLNLKELLQLIFHRFNIALPLRVTRCLENIVSI